MLDQAAMERRGPMTPRPFRVVDLRLTTHDTATLTFEPADGEDCFRFRPAQIGMVGLPGLGEVPISFSSDPADGDRLAMTIRRAGAITSALLALAPGDVVTMRGPYGSEWPIESMDDSHVLFVAGGLGLAPLRSAVVTALARPPQYRSLPLAYGAREPSEFVFGSELELWDTDPVLRLLLTVDRPDEGWSGRIGLVTASFDEAIEDPSQTVALVCGPDVMMKAVGADLSARGLDESRIWLTMERNMKCGIGLCGHCQFGRYFLCKDGPVLAWRDVRRLYQIAEL